MKILITGNPSFNSLCWGLERQLHNHSLKFISRGLGFDLSNTDNVVSAVNDYEIFVNSTHIPDNGQLKILNKLKEVGYQGHVVNISTTSVYWENLSKPKYYYDKLELEKRSKELSNEFCYGQSSLRVSCIAFGSLDSEEKRSNGDPAKKRINLDTAAFYVKALIESSPDININYICLDPIQITH